MGLPRAPRTAAALRWLALPVGVGLQALGRFDVMASFRVGVQLHPQHCSIDELRGAWETADALGVDSIWTWDHFYPLYGDDTGAHFEGWTLLAAMAVDHHQRPHRAAGHRQLVPEPRPAGRHGPHGRPALRRTDLPGHRVRVVREGLRRVRLRVRHRAGPPARAGGVAEAHQGAPRRAEPRPGRSSCPFSSAGRGEKVTLRLVAQYADAWNTFGPPANFAGQERACSTSGARRSGRDPRRDRAHRRHPGRTRSTTSTPTSRPAPPMSSS